MLFIGALCVFLDTPLPFVGESFAFASYYQDNMVLQRAPVRARVWGYGHALDEQVDVTIVVEGSISTFTAMTRQGNAGKAIWSVDLNPIDAGGPYIITAKNGICSISLTNIKFGDVWLCAGQSNMVYVLEKIDDAQEEIDDVVNYPDIRVFKSDLKYSSKPMEDLMGISTPWSVPSPDTIGTFSAVCWLYAKHLYSKYQIPIGLVQSAWGGTRIEAWSSRAALNVCFPNGTVAYNHHETRNKATVLYNAMIHPFLPMPIYGAIWYQGEKNSFNSDNSGYGCAIQQMVADWRKSWFQNTPSMDPVFPFGEVQLAANEHSSVSDHNRGFPDVRWAQTYQYGYAPNDQLERFFLAVTMDLADFDSPRGPIHPRFKRQVANRLALGAYAVAYGDESSGLWQAPVPTSFSIDDGYLTVIIGEGSVQVEVRDTETSTHYEVCCSADPTLECEGEGDGRTTYWHRTTFVSLDAGHKVTVSVPCAAEQFVVGVRYAWRETPCPNLEACAFYTVENGLPLPQYIHNGLIVGSIWDLNQFFMK